MSRASVPQAKITPLMQAVLWMVIERYGAAATMASLSR
jgi:hypothetical protein